MPYVSKVLIDVLQQLAFKSTQPQNANKGPNIVLMNPEIHIHNDEIIPNSRKRKSVETDELIKKLQAEIEMKDNQIERERKENEAFMQKTFGKGMESFSMETELRADEQTINQEKLSKRIKTFCKRSKSETDFQNDSTEIWETSDGKKFIHLNQNSNSWKRNAKEDENQSSCSQEKSQPKSTNSVVQSPTKCTPVSISFDEDVIPNNWIHKDTRPRVISSRKKDDTGTATI